ncbi:proline dehydrogenase family protein [Candidatus Caldipriscus sp.]|nr:proline dehydrogenase family protein [Candidatus Caldipriscus sp.]
MPILRNLFIYLSHNKTLERFLTGNSFGRKISRRFVAGESLRELEGVARKLIEDGFLLTVAYLGEHFKDLETIKRHKGEYLKLAEVLKNFNSRAEISLKPSQLGMELGREVFYENLKEICKEANNMGIYINVDAEEYRTVWDTVEVVERLNMEGFKVGTVIQAYLFDADKILERLAKFRINLRLVKGAYKESPKVAYQRKKDIDERFKVLAEKMLRIEGVYPEFGTHDDKLIRYIMEFGDKIGKDKTSYEFQMLYGVRQRLQREILDKGYRVRIYLPYGDYWYPYFMRRLAEKPSNAILVLRGAFG